ncbi:indole-3-glycerol phosphate synthase TrpC [Pendulispora rubella]|uniref:indole-3-glycerol-phosphate synthase n=1 Tax=Pendulispora rubella TaxID=2741070 RepID=A0ABZ2KRJ8_9BACT
MILDKIVTSKRAEIATLKAPPPTTAGPRIDVAALLKRGPKEPLRILTEFKRKSPSAGELSRTLSLAERVGAYAKAGSSLVSVLCDGPFFGGSYDDVVEARAVLDRAGRPVPILAKEFILDPVQLQIARAKGADAALLIVRILQPDEVTRLVKASRECGLEPLVEVATEEELAIALNSGARLIGVNARDLDTLRMDPVRASKIVAAIPADRVAVHLSGLKTEDDVRALSKGRAEAALVGEILMRQDDPTDLLTRFVAAARE